MTRSLVVSTTTPLKLGNGATTMRTGGRSALVSMDCGTARRCWPASCASGIRQIDSDSTAAWVFATNICSTDEPRCETETTHSATATTSVLSSQRRTSVLPFVGPGSGRRRLGRLREEPRVGPGDDLVDDGFHGFPRVGCVVSHVIARRVDAWDLRPPILAQQLVRVPVP